jgi:putative transposase
MRLISTKEEGVCEFATSVPRLVQRVTRPMLGFKSIDSAQSTLVGIELMHMLREGQLDDGLARDLTLAERFYSLAA